MSPETLRVVYFAYIHSIMSYGIICGGNQPYSDKIFKIKKRVIRIITMSMIDYVCICVCTQVCMHVEQVK